MQAVRGNSVSQGPLTPPPSAQDRTPLPPILGFSSPEHRLCRVDAPEVRATRVPLQGGGQPPVRVGGQGKRDVLPLPTCPSHPLDLILRVGPAEAATFTTPAVPPCRRRFPRENPIALRPKGKTALVCLPTAQ